MIGTYQADREFADVPRLVLEAKRIIGMSLVEVSSFQMDTEEAADFVLPMATVAFRTRREFDPRGRRYSEQYPNQFTIRLSRSSGVATEYDKIMDGYGDFMLYAHQAGEGLGLWHMLDLSVLRCAQADHTCGLTKLTFFDKTNTNDGGKTGFRAYDLTSFDAHYPIVVCAGYGANFG